MGKASNGAPSAQTGSHSMQTKQWQRKSLNKTLLCFRISEGKNWNMCVAMLRHQEHEVEHLFFTLEKGRVSFIDPFIKLRSTSIGLPCQLQASRGQIRIKIQPPHASQAISTLGRGFASDFPSKMLHVGSLPSNAHKNLKIFSYVLFQHARIG